MWRGLKRLGVAESSLDDAAQDVFLVVFRRWDEFRGESSVRTWIYGIVLRVASTYRRSHRRSELPVDEERLGTSLDVSANPFDEASWREAARILSRAMDGLEEPVRAVFVLVELEELTVQQAAELLGVTEATGRSRLRTARTHVNAAVERERARDHWRLP